MPLRFGPYKRDEEEAPRPHRAAPDYTSRRTRFRLWILVGMAMLVITLMFEARKPEHYAWMWRLGKPEQIEKKPVTPHKVNLKVVPRAKPAIPIAPEEVPGSNRKADSDSLTAAAEPEKMADAELLSRTRKDGWLQNLEQLPPDEHKPGHDLLFALLRVARANSEASDEERLYGAKLLMQLDQGWTAYRTNAINSIAGLSDNEKEGWLTILDTLAKEWSAGALPALQSVVEGKRLDEAQRAALDNLQKLLDQLALAAIQDNTVPNRPVERHAWFRLFEVLGGADESTLKDLSQGTVGYVQLFKQPKDYRGKLVTIKGTVELAYRVQAMENVEGIKQYYIFWLRPAEGVDSPFVIYALETPPGFPKVLDKDEQNQATNRLQVDAEFTGYFFKKMAYLSRKDTRTTPLLLARSPHFDEQMGVAAVARPPRKLPSPLAFLLVLGGTGGFGLAVAAIAYFTTRRPRKVEEFPADISASDLGRLESRASAARGSEK